MNRLTKTIDVDIYDENSKKVDVKLPSNFSIKITIGRMKEKDNTGLGILAMPTAVNINVTVGNSNIGLLIIQKHQCPNLMNLSLVSNSPKTGFN